MRDYAELVARLKQSDDNCNAECCECSGECLSSGHNIFCEAADAIEELLAKVPRWISVEERLPESGERVLIMFKPLEGEENISIGWLTKSGFDCYDDSVYFFRSVTHWMPLPEAPEPPKGAE